MFKINAIVACCENNGIGINGKLPWSLREEMKHFARMTKATDNSSKKNAVIMGRNTWQSIPKKFRPLAGRLNIVISTQAVENPELFNGCVPCESFSKSLEEVESRSDEIEKIWIIGGSSIYKLAFSSNLMERIYMTKILKNFECDVFLPEVDFETYKLVEDPLVPTEVQEEGNIKYKYEVYEKI